LRENAQASNAPESPAQSPPPAAESRLDADAAKQTELDSFKKSEPPAAVAGIQPPSPQATGVIAGGRPAAAPAAPPVPVQSASAAAGSTNRQESARAADLREAVAPVEVRSPDPRVRWRIAGTLLQRSTNGGGAWEATSSGVGTELTEGAAPSPTVCWIVGRAGVVLLSTDGRAFRRLPFPEITDLSAVRARDARAASVTAADGRVFSTIDAGASWTPGPLQGF
jgi:hypothetical protein